MHEKFLSKAYFKVVMYTCDLFDSYPVTKDTLGISKNIS